MTLALIPPSLDQVLVGSIERSRHPDLKAVFVVGCTQKQFPVPVSYGGLLSESDRATAKADDFELGPGLRDNLAQREYLAYIAFTRPAEFLYVSYPLTEGKGSPAVRSQFVWQLESLFSDICVESAVAEDSIERVQTEGELRELLCRKLGKDSENSDKTEQGRLGQLLCDMECDEQLSETAQEIESAIDYENRAELDSQVVAELVGKQINSSATRLSTFAACPYQYFARYELDLKERKEFTFEPLDKGLFYHKVLEELIKALGKRKIDITELSEDELAGILRERIAKLLQDDSFICNFIGHSKHNAYIIESASDSLGACVLDMAKMIGAGMFRPRRCEITFDDYLIDMPDGRKLILRGKIDRVDEAEIDGVNCALIFDYKLRGRSYSWSWFYHGLDMQLAIYMLAVQQSRVEPVGAFFIPIEAGASKTGVAFGHKANGIFNGEYFKQLDKQIESRWSKYYNFYVSQKDGQYGDYSRSGSLKSDDFEKVLTFTQRRIVELVSKIAEGKIEVTPYRLNNKVPCGYCKYKSVCRFDWQINDYRVLEPVGKKAMLERI
jgi:ATP-dependent helicase/nuclease subunit B